MSGSREGTFNVGTAMPLTCCDLLPSGDGAILPASAGERPSPVLH